MSSPTACVLAALAISAVCSSQAFAGETPVGGGPGGNAFRITCPAGSFVVGFAYRNGQWFDRIAPICAPWQLAERRFGPGVAGGAAGDSEGGRPHTEQCPLGQYAITAVRFGLSLNGDDDRPQFVGWLDAHCQTVRPPWDARSISMGNPTNATWAHSRNLVEPTIERPQYHFVCPQGEVAVGIQGRAGLFVDALGLICAPAPTVKTGVDQARVTADRPWQAAGRVGTALGGTTCGAGFVPRKAAANDDVCVTPESHERVLRENSSAQSRRDPKGGPYGANTCLAGFVWRGAFNGDYVCVTPEVRDVVRRENEAASARSVGPTTLMRR